MARRRKFVNKSDYPDHVIERLARTFYPDILASFQSEEGQNAFQDWMKKKQENGSIQVRLRNRTPPERHYQSQVTK